LSLSFNLKWVFCDKILLDDLQMSVTLSGEFFLKQQNAKALRDVCLNQ